MMTFSRNTSEAASGADLTLSPGHSGEEHRHAAHCSSPHFRVCSGYPDDEEISQMMSAKRRP